MLLMRNYPEFPLGRCGSAPVIESQDILTTAAGILRTIFTHNR
jgi:hypothetical protein